MTMDRFYLVLISMCLVSFLVYGGLYIYIFSMGSLKMDIILMMTTIQMQRSFPDANTYVSVNKIMPDTVSAVSCTKLFDGDLLEMNKTFKLMENFALKAINNKEYISMTKNCSSFRNTRGYINSPLNSFEEQFPLAFSIVMYKDVYQAERLVRAIYRPQNIYCIHVDRKAARGVKDAIRSIASCFENVFIASQLYSVQWGTISVLDAELSCMRDLLYKHKSWKYFINLTGQEFPLKTNYELVKILSVYNGANDISGTINRKWYARWKDAGKVPHNIRPFKGSIHIVANREFINFLINNQSAQEFYNWTKRTKIPDETFFSTLNFNPVLRVRGQYNGSKPSHQIRNFSRLKIWLRKTGTSCHGKIVRGICILGIGDLPFVRKSDNFFVNKFYWNYQSFTLDCMEELYFNRTGNEYEGLVSINTSVYEQADIVKYAIR